ncbi:MAG: DUF2236 domain-containing protein [Anaerolineae bacterium]|nr:DUF2236 domain-containing protein [Anaerolineae bacterium]
MFGRYANLNYILTLDPQRDHEEIVRRVGGYEYPWMMRKALEFALFRTYAVPTISAILDASGHFARQGQKRYDDTALIIAEITENGYDSERGRAAIRRMNQLHRRWNIAQEDYLYVLSTFIFVPVYWHRDFGWRQPTQHENLANYYFWCEVGKRMNIQNIPPTYAAFEAFHQAYEAQHFRYTPASARVGEATLQIFLAWYPRPLAPLLRQIIYTFMDDRLRAAFGFPRPPAALKALVHGAVKLAGTFIRVALPPRRRPFSLLNAPNRTYPHGYSIEHLGTEERIAGDNDSTTG